MKIQAIFLISLKHDLVLEKVYIVIPNIKLKD